METCDPNYGCGRTTRALFSVLTKNDDDEVITVKVCSDCAAHGDWEEERDD